MGNFNMDELYEYLKNSVVNFKLERCCCFAPIRIGVLVIGYFNLFMALLFLLDESDLLTPPLKAAQATINEDEISKPFGILAYSTEVAFNTLLLCGMYRNDIVLLRVYIYFLVASIICSLLVYSIVFAAMSVLVELLIVFNWAFQCYLILLVRSAIVEIKQTESSNKNGQVTLYSVVQVPDEVPTKETKDEHDVEVVVEPENDSKVNDETSNPEQNKDEPPTKLETINESKKEDVNVV